MRRRTIVAAGVVCAFVAAAAGVSLLRGHTAAVAPAERQTPSGLPVPRYVSLKFATVNARAGPGDDRRLLFVYHAEGLPVQVVAETDDWRRICDADGSLSWVHRRTTDGRRTVMPLAATPTPLKAKPRPEAAVVAYLAPRAVAGLQRCDKGWCAIRIGSITAWAPQAALWGVAETAQCR